MADAGISPIHVRSAGSGAAWVNDYLRGLVLHFRETGQFRYARSLNAPCGRRWAQVREHAALHPEARVFVWEQGDRYDTFDAAVRCGRSIVAVPQNIESLTGVMPSGRSPRSVLKELRTEVDRYRRSDAVFVISREEQWLLAGLGVEAIWLPYHPPRERLSQLAAIRSARVGGGGKFLVFGNVYNPPTMDGMIELGRLFAELRLPPDFPRIQVAGLGTETLAGKMPADRFDILGTVSHELLRMLQIEARAVLIYQRFGTGFLTRITEFLHAGVPVLCNDIASRSANHLHGVHTFLNVHELIDLMRQSLSTPVPPVRPTMAINDFTRTIAHLSL